MSDSLKVQKPVSPEEISIVTAILSKIQRKDLEDERFAPLTAVVQDLFGRIIKKQLFGDKNVVEFLREQNENRDLLRRLNKLHNIVQQNHAANVENARSTGINSIRDARTAEVNTLGLSALTSQESASSLQHDFSASLLLLKASSPPNSTSLPSIEPISASVQSSGQSCSDLKQAPQGEEPHYSSSVDTFQEYRAGGIGRSRGTRANFDISRVRGMYDDHAEAEPQNDSENDEPFWDPTTDPGAIHAGQSSVRSKGTVNFIPRIDALNEGQSDDQLHPGLWLCFVADDDDGKRRACAHRTIVDIASHLDSLGMRLSARHGESYEFPCTYIAGKRRQKWALLGNEVSDLTGETAISVKLSASVLTSAAPSSSSSGSPRKLLRDSSSDPSTTCAPQEEPLFAPLPGDFQRHCNVCKNAYMTLHSFYHQLCIRCGDFNFKKRLQSSDMGGLVCLVTGGRVRIGFQIGLKLLRAGATVIVTTRFVHDAALRYSLEEGYDKWKNRLVVECLELTDIVTVEAYCKYLAAKYVRIHVLINNAAQTITRTQDWTGKMDQLEHNSGLLLCASSAVPLLTSWNESCPLIKNLDQHCSPDAENIQREVHGVISRRNKETSKWLIMDESGQPVDLAPENSWSRRLEDVSISEVTQTIAVNSISPFVLCSKLKQLLRPAAAGDPFGHIVNVSSLEGKFNVGKKSTFHPHTNCAKAALNMLTLTSAREYARSGILMNAVDTGWITDWAPNGNTGASSRMHETFVNPPLDEIDGAARVLDPIFIHINSGGKEKVYGQFLKDYCRASW